MRLSPERHTSSNILRYAIAFCIGLLCLAYQTNVPVQAAYPEGTEFVYFANGEGNTISEYRTASNGVLKPLTPSHVSIGGIAKSQTPRIICVARNHYVYVINLPDEPAPHENYNNPHSSVSLLRIKTNGQLKLLFSKVLDLNIPVTDFCVSPNGKNAYLVGNEGSLLSYTVRFDGSLKRIGPVIGIEQGLYGFHASFTFANHGHRLYCATSAELLGFGIRPGGILKPIRNEPLDKGILESSSPDFYSGFENIVFQPNEHFAYSVLKGVLRTYWVEKDGNLRLTTRNSNFSVSDYVAIDPNGLALYDMGGEGIEIYKIIADGKLSAKRIKTVFAGRDDFSMRFNFNSKFAYCLNYGPPNYSRVYAWQFRRGRDGLLTPNNPPNVSIGYSSSRPTFARL